MSLVIRKTSGTPFVAESSPPTPEPPDASKTGDATDACGTSAFVFGDLQFSYLKTHTAIRSLTVTSYSPAVRLPASEIAIPMVYQQLVRKYYSKLPAECRASSVGGIVMGDIGDTGAKPEMGYFRTVQQRLEKTYPDYGVFTMAPGNHDAFPNGTFNTGEAFFALGLLLNLESLDRSYIDNIATYEVGEKGMLLQKEDLLKFNHQMQRLPWNPTEVPYADKTHYVINGSPSGWEWTDRRRAMAHFWQPASDGRSWNALVHYKADDDGLKPEQQWLALRAQSMGEFKTDSGQVPVYLITLDSIDFIEDSSTNGAINGHISFLQTRLVQSFMAAMKHRNPKAKFILASHFPLDNIDEAGFKTANLLSPTRLVKPTNDFHEVLEDPSVVTLLVAHTHRWDYKDLNDPELASTLKIAGRNTPLPQINIPSLIDHPIGSGWLNVHTDGTDLLIDFRKVEVDTADLKASANASVRKELERIDPELTTYVPAWKNLQDNLLKFLSHPEAQLGDQLPVLLDYDFGKLYEAGRINDHLVAQDTLFIMFQTARLKLLLYMAALKLALQDAGLPQEAEKLDTHYRTYLSQLDTYYQTMLTRYANGQPFDDEKTKLDKIQATLSSLQGEGRSLLEHQEEPLLRAFLETADKVREKKEAAAPGTPAHELLAQSNSMLGDLGSLLSVYREWLKRYEGMLAARRPANEVATMSDLMVTAEWERIEQSIRALPIDSSPSVFLTLAGLRSAELRSQFFRRVENLKMPDAIQVRVHPKDGSITRTKLPVRLTAAETAARKAELPRPPGWSPEFLDDTTSRLHHPGWVGHWVLRAGEVGDTVWSPRAFLLQGGGQGHWFPSTYGYMRMSGLATLDLLTSGPNGTELNLSTGLYADLLGHVALGPVGNVGVSFGNLGHGGKIRVPRGVGGELSLLEGFLNLRVMHTWYGSGLEDTAWQLSTDFFALGRFWNFWPRHQ